MNTQTTTNDVAAPVKAKAAKKAAKATAPAPAVKGPVIKLTAKAPDFKDGTARALWYGAVKKANGKPVDEFVEAASKTPPAKTKNGTAEHPMGWLRYFAKEGMVELVSN